MRILRSSLISQDCQSGSIGQSSPGGPGIKVASSHDMHSENSFVCHLLLFVVFPCLSSLYDRRHRPLYGNISYEGSGMIPG